jgi:hypothetical protein
MSINLTYQKFSPAEFARVTASQAAWQAARAPLFPGLDVTQLQEMSKNPSQDAMQKLTEALQAKASDTSRLDLDKWWHVFYFLLTGSHEITEGHRPGVPLHNAVFGGTPTAVKTGYGPVRALTGETLREVSEAVKSVSADAFLQRWNPEEMREKDIYACPDEEEREMAVELFEQFKSFLVDAQARGDVVVLYGH